MRVAQIILAAGASERMGRVKALLDFGGRTALRRIVDAGTAGAADGVVVVVGQNAAEVQDACSLDDAGVPVRWVVNEERGSPQLESLKRGLESLRSETPQWFFFQPVDCPLVEAGDYAALLRRAEEPAGTAGVFYLSHAGRRGHPVLCRGDLAGAFIALDPGATARDVLQAQEAKYVLSENPGVLDDMDTPEDYERLLRRSRRSG
jgi:molybdenum cofactor cytidylyltransferase